MTEIEQMVLGARSVLLLALLAGCAPGPGATQAAAGAGRDGQGKFRAPAEQGCGSEAFLDLCRVSDEDYPPHIPAFRTEPSCQAVGGGMPGKSLFEQALTALPEDFQALHRVCALMEPQEGTLDHQRPEVGRVVRDYFRSLLARPALQRALAGMPADEDARVAALEETWLTGNAFEHVFCGEVNERGSLGGYHMWSEFFLAEQEGRVAYHCTRRTDPRGRIATMKFEWQGPGLEKAIEKPTGGFFVGMSPACMLALGHVAHTAPCERSVRMAPAFEARMYGVPVSWVYWRWPDGTMLTLFPL